MGAPVTKQRLILCDRSILYHTLSAFERCPEIRSIVVVTREDELDFAHEQSVDFSKVTRVVVGGATRADSAAIGVSAVPSETEFVCVHDAARCLITPEFIGRVAQCAYLHKAACAVGTVQDTVKRVGRDALISETIPRDCLRLAQTPQIFDLSLYRSALKYALTDGASVTDDSQLFERIGIPVATVENPDINIKITTPADLLFAEFVMKERK